MGYHWVDVDDLQYEERPPKPGDLIKIADHLVPIPKPKPKPKPQ